MIVYRIAKEKYKTDLSGIGAEKFGGRWNSKGTRLVYTAASRALATLEVAVHIALKNIPKNYYLTAIEIPDPLITSYDIALLADKNWKTHPPIHFTQLVGDQFVASEGLVLQVPSAIVEGDYNYLINPLHPEFLNVKTIESVPFSFDSRLFLSM